MSTTRKKTTRKRSPKASVYIKPEADERVSCTVCGVGMQESQSDPMGLCPKCHKKEGMQYADPEAAQDPDTAPTPAPQGAPKRKRGRKAKAEEPANPAAEGATPAPEVDDDPFRDIPLAECDQPKPAPEAPEAPAPAPRKKATRKGKAKPAADTGADSGLTMATLADQYLAHLEAAGKSRGTVFSYSIDAAIAVRHFGEGTLVSSLTPKQVQDFYDSDLVTKTRTGKPKAQPTILKSRRVLRLALVWATEAGIIAEAPLPTANS